MKHPLASCACALLLALTLFVFNPGVVYQNNVHEFSTTLSGLLAEAWPWAIGLFLLSFVTLLILDWLGLRRLLALALVSTFLVWIQSSFLSFSYGKLDGSGLNFAANAWRSAYELPLWIALGAFALWRPTPILRNCALVAFLLVGAQAAVLLSNEFALREDAQPATSALKGEIPEHYFRYGPDTNVLHLVLDEFGSNMMSQVLAARPELEDAFQGFTFYRDAMGLFPTTNVSMHAILTGQVYDYQEPLADQIARELPERGLATMLGDEGFDTHLIAKYYLCQRMGRECRIVPGTSPAQQAYNDSLQLLDFGLFRASPHVIKATFFGAGAELLQSRYAVGDEAMRTLSYQAVSFMRQAIKKSSFDSSLPPQYNFYHVALPHLPIVTDSDCNYIGKQVFGADAFLVQSECAARITVELLAKLKQIGVYDKTLIVIHADHGSWFDIPKVKDVGDGRPSAWDMSRSSALLMVKHINASGPLAYSDAPASLADIRPTILSALEVSPEKPGVLAVSERSSRGVNLLELSQEARRDRQYWGFEWKGALSERDFLPASDKYLIRGNHSDQDNWIHEGESAGSCIYTLGAVVDFRREASLPFCVSSGLSIAEAQHTWTKGPAVTLQFDLDLASYDDGDLKMRLRSGAFVPDEVPIEGTLSLGGEQLGEIRFTDGNLRDLFFTIPAELVSSSMEIRIAIDNPRRPFELGISTDKRALGLRLYQFEMTHSG